MIQFIAFDGILYGARHNLDREASNNQSVNNNLLFISLGVLDIEDLNGWNLTF